MMREWTNDIHQGDAVETLQQMPESSVHMAMCSPPYYGLRDYGVDGQIGLEESLTEYIQSLVDIGAELKRVLRNDGSWWLNLGDSYAGSGGGGGQWTDESHGSARYSGKAGDSYNGPLNHQSLERKQKMLVPHRVALALQNAGWVVRSDVVWAKPNPMPHPVADRLREDKEFIFHLTPRQSYWFDLDSIREPHKESALKRSNFDPSTAGKGSNEIPGEDGSANGGLRDGNFLHPNGKNPGDIFEITVRAFPEAHFAVYPPELCKKPILATCPPEVCSECGKPLERESEVVDREVPGGVSRVPKDERPPGGKPESDRIGLTQPTERRLGPWEKRCDCDTERTAPGIAIDPFAGAGTTCLVAKRLGRRFIGIELNPEYVALAQKRVGVTVDEPERLLEDGDVPLQAFANGGNTLSDEVGEGPSTDE